VSWFQYDWVLIMIPLQMPTHGSQQVFTSVITCLWNSSVHNVLHASAMHDSYRHIWLLTVNVNMKHTWFESICRFVSDESIQIDSFWEKSAIQCCVHNSLYLTAPLTSHDNAVDNIKKFHHSETNWIKILIHLWELNWYIFSNWNAVIRNIC